VHRFRREYLAAGEDVNTAILQTINSAGRTVAISSLTVAFGLSTLLLLPIPFMRSLGMAGLIVPITSLIAAITLQPALLSYLGKYCATPNSFAGLLAKRDLNKVAKKYFYLIGSAIASSWGRCTLVTSNTKCANNIASEFGVS
jgi:uncharacterized membrane protein YdfJ with MMPL/SSD domain